jgi:hypothetical protein
MMANAVDYNITPQLRSDLKQWRTRALIAGVVGTAISAAGFFAAGPTQFYRSYLWSFMFIVGLTIGSAGVAHAAIRHRRRLGPGDPALLRGAPTPCRWCWMFLPIVIGINNLYPWAHAAKVAADPLLQHKAPYLNVPFFLAVPPSTSPAGCSSPGGSIAGH